MCGSVEMREPKKHQCENGIEVAIIKRDEKDGGKIVNQSRLI
jgi:hypothetical protein